MLTDAQIERYARHVLLPEVGGRGQERLLASRVAVTGLGPVGAWATAYLALAGVGRLALDDRRPVGPGDLVPLLGPGDVGRPRDEAIAAALPAYNPDVRPVVSRISDLAPRPPAPGGSGAGTEEAGSAAPSPPPGETAGDGSPVGAWILSGEGDALPPLGADAPGRPAGAAAGPVVVAFASGEGSVAGALEPTGPCPACVARVLGEPAPPSPAAAVLAGSTAAARVLARIAAGAKPAPGFLVGQGGALRPLDSKAIPCPHRR